MTRDQLIESIADALTDEDPQMEAPEANALAEAVADRLILDGSVELTD